MEEMGYLLIRLREDPTLEFEPRVFKSKLEEIAQTAKAEGAREERERVLELVESRVEAVAMFPISKKADKQELSALNQLKKLIKKK